MSEHFDIDELEAELGQPAALRVFANVGGQCRLVPRPKHASKSALAQEVGPVVARWIADRFGGEVIAFPSRYGRDARDRAALLRADILEAGLTDPVRSANDIAGAHGVTSRRVEQVRQELRSEAPERPLPLFRNR